MDMLVIWLCFHLWGVFDLLPSPKKTGAHVGRNLIYIDPGKIARKTGKQHDWNELEILARKSFTCSV